MTAPPENASDADQILDARGLYCPVPLLRLKRRLRTLTPGRCVILLATDPAAPRDVAAFCREEGHDDLGHRERGDGTIEIAVRAGPAGSSRSGTPVL